MTELLSGVDAPSDAELISRVRGGDVAAYGELFARHVEAARRLGRQLVRGTDVDDLVSDAFAKVLHVLQDGGGPDVAFRAYLLTSVRRLHIDRIRAAAKVQPSDDMAQFDNGIPFQDTAVASFDNGAAARAFASLPERWQLVLWHLEVEGQKPADIAPLLGMTANSVSALAYRAREGLRQAFLTMHLADNAGDDCRWVTEHLGAYVRKGLAKRDTTKVKNHLDQCRRCTAMHLELTEVNSNLAGIIAPLLLGAAAASYVSSGGGAAGLTGVSAAFGRVRDLVTANVGGGATAGAGSAVTSGGLLTAGAIAAGVAAVTSAALVFGGGGAKDVLIEADQPVRVVQTPPAGGPAPEDASSGDASSGTDPTQPPSASLSEVDDVSDPVAATEPVDTSSGSDQAGPAEPDSDRPGTDAPGTDAPGTDPSPGTPPAEPGTDSPPSGDPGTSPPPVDDGDPPPASPEPDMTPPVISLPPIAVDPPPLPPVVTPPVAVPPPGALPPAITPPAVVIPDEPAVLEFGFVGTPLVSEVDGGSPAAGEHYYAVSLSFDGVKNGNHLELVLSAQAGFCLPDGCALGTLENSKTFVVSGLAEGTSSHTVTFQARMPGGSPVGVVARLNDGQPLPELVLRSP
jgi:RNA polymerase sigma factor (sigma-70 family)